MRPVTRCVLKFGGTSVGSPAALQSVVGIVDRSVRETAVVVVVSAVAGITDKLEWVVTTAARREQAPVTLVEAIAGPNVALARQFAGPHAGDRAVTAVRGLATGLSARLDAIAAAGEGAPALRDAVLATGERMAVVVVTAALRAAGLDAFGCDATELIRTDASFGEARVDLPSTRQQTRARLGPVPRWTVPVVTGFIGATPTGDTTILGRGGSDYSAALLGWALDVDRVEIWSDVDGIMTADPRVVRGARTLQRLSYREAAALAEAGARVLHPRTLQPLERAGIPVVIRNTFRPEAPGTRVGRETGANDRPQAAIASRVQGDVAHVLVLDEAGTASDRAARVRAALRAAGVEPRAVTSVAGDLAVRIVVDARLHVRAVQAIHDLVVAPGGHVDVVAAGPDASPDLTAGARSAVS